MTNEIPQGVILDTLTYHLHKNVIEGKDVPNYDILCRLISAKGDDDASRQFNSQLCGTFFGKEGMPLDSAVHIFADSLAQAYEVELKQFYDPTCEDSFVFQYTYDMQASVEDDSRAGISAYSVIVTSYMGGAHGSHDVYCLNLNNHTGRAIRCADFFRQESISQVKGLIEKSLMDRNGCTSMEQLMEKTSICSLGEVYVRDNNFLLLSDSVEFLYNPYEIAPWACGLISARVSYSDLSSCIIPDVLPQK